MRTIANALDVIKRMADTQHKILDDSAMILILSNNVIDLRERRNQ
jgi:hypothetical protein